MMNLEDMIRSTRPVMAERTQHRICLQEAIEQRIAAHSKPWQFKQYVAMMGSLAAVLMILASQPGHTYKRIESLYEEFQLRRPDLRTRAGLVHFPPSTHKDAVHPVRTLESYRQAMALLNQ